MFGVGLISRDGGTHFRHVVSQTLTAFSGVSVFEGRFALAGFNASAGAVPNRGNVVWLTPTRRTVLKHHPILDVRLTSADTSEALLTGANGSGVIRSRDNGRSWTLVRQFWGREFTRLVGDYAIGANGIGMLERP